MRILHVNKFLRVVGGAETYMFTVAQLQREQGNEVAFFGLEHEHNDVAVSLGQSPQHLAKKRALDNIDIPVRAKASNAAAMIWNVDAQRAMTKTLEQFQPDVVHLHNIYHQLSPSILRPLKENSIPTVMTVHDYKLICPSYKLLADGEVCERCIDGRFRSAVMQKCQSGSRLQSSLLAIESRLHRTLQAYDPVDLFLCPSRFMAEKLAEANVFADRLRHIPNFVAPAEAASPEHESRPIILFVGRLSHEKGVDVLVEAANLLQGNADVVIIGDGPEQESLHELVRASGSSARLIGRKTPAEVRQWLQRASALVVPSRWHENQPISILEALSQKVPVIATDLGGLGELVIDGQTGLIVPADDAVSLARAIDHLASSSEIVADMGERGLALVEQEHSTNVHEQRLLTLYSEAMTRVKL